MEEKTEMLHKLCKALMEELDEYSKKIEKSDGMSAGDLEAVDKLSHALKSVKTTIAMMEAGEEDSGYSGHYIPYWGMSYAGGRGGNQGGSNRGGNYNRNGGSYARGGRNNNPMGRNQYSREGYSYAEEDMMNIIEEIRGMMDDLPEEKRRKVERLVMELER